MKRSITTLLAVLVLVFGVTPVAQADSAGEIKSRMAQRLGQIVALKQSEAVGENNEGYLTVRTGLSEADAALVKAENADRKAVYQMIAAKTNANATTVGKTRAASIRSKAVKGTWVQLADGTWRKV